MSELTVCIIQVVFTFIAYMLLNLGYCMSVAGTSLVYGHKFTTTFRQTYFSKVSYLLAPAISACILLINFLINVASGKAGAVAPDFGCVLAGGMMAWGCHYKHCKKAS